MEESIRRIAMFHLQYKIKVISQINIVQIISDASLFNTEDLI